MTTDLRPRPYEPAARCPKCGYDLVSTEYRAGSHPRCALDWNWETQQAMLDMYSLGFPPADPPTWDPPDTPEHLERKCVRCGHGWAEDVLREAVA